MATSKSLALKDKHYYVYAFIGQAGPPKTYLGQVLGYNLPTPSGETGGTLSILNFSNQKLFSGMVSQVIDNGDETETLIINGMVGTTPATGTVILSADGKSISVSVSDSTFDPDNALSSGHVNYGYMYP